MSANVSEGLCSNICPAGYVMEILEPELCTDPHGTTRSTNATKVTESVSIFISTFVFLYIINTNFKYFNHLASMNGIQSSVLIPIVVGSAVLVIVILSRTLKKATKFNNN